MRLRQILDGAKEVEFFTQSDLINKHGWTKSLIDKYLPEPVIMSERLFSGNVPYHYMKLYSKDDVYRVESKPEVRNCLNKTALRRVEAYLNTFTQTQQKPPRDVGTINQVIGNIKVVRMPEQVVEQLGFNYMMEWLSEHPNAKNVVDVHDTVTIHRGAVKYICDNLTTCEMDMKVLNNCRCVEIDFINYRKALYRKIAQTYPIFQKECEGQILNGSLKYTEKVVSLD